MAKKMLPPPPRFFKSWTENYKFIVISHLSWCGFQGGIVVKNLPANAGDTGGMGSIPGSGRSPGGGNSNPLPWVAQMVKHLPTIQEIWVQSLVQEYLLEKEMATYSSVLAWKILSTEEPGSL